MDSGGIIDAGTGVANSVGRYFSIVSFIPSSLYVVFVYLLVTSGGWHHPPDWSQAFASLGHVGVDGFALLVFLAIGLGIVIHPVQFALVQFFEGYWGTWPVSQKVRYRRIIHYQRRCEKLNKVGNRAIAALDDPAANDLGTHNKRAPVRSRRDEADRVRDMFPRDLDEVMPTRLGNMLRRFEAQAGKQYGIDAVQAVPHLMLIAPANHVDYVNDQRSQLDLAVRMTFMSAVAAITAVILLGRDGAWALIALIPYALAYCSYRGAVVAAGHYGAALETLIHLNRFALYQQLHVRLPASTTDEQATNAALAALLGNKGRPGMDYVHPAPEGGTKPTP